VTSAGVTVDMALVAVAVALLVINAGDAETGGRILNISEYIRGAEKEPSPTSHSRSPKGPHEHL
jgi:hypothetical protein